MDLDDYRPRPGESTAEWLLRQPEGTRIVRVSIPPRSLLQRIRSAWRRLRGG
jgi:hypothetical protein